MSELRVTRGRIWRCVLASLLLLVLVGIAAPFIRADRYGEDIRNSLQHALGRRVEILDRVTFNLFTGPGFTLTDVVIYDDDSSGLEPFAHMEALQARVKLTSLLLGRLEFSTVRLVRPDVNLVKREGQPWNVLPLLQRQPSGRSAFLPELQVSEGRFNFKFDDMKSVFYLSNADVTIRPKMSKTGTYQVKFFGQPARTDRAARAFGSFRVRGDWAMEPESQLDLEVELERSSIGEIATLVRADMGELHGVVQSRAHIYGPLSNLTIDGRAQMEDVHRWDLMPARSGGWALNYKGTCDLWKQTLQASATPKFNPGLPLSVRLVASKLLTSPEWQTTVQLSGFPATALLEVARHMGAPLPAGLAVEGNVHGSVSYLSTTGLEGKLQVANAALNIGGESRLRVPEASVFIETGQVRLLPSTLVGDEGQEATIEASYTPASTAVDATITGRSLRIADLQGKSGGLLGGGALPLAQHFRGGVWSGAVQYHQSEGVLGHWTGKFAVRDTVGAVPGMADPIKISTASVELDGERLAVKGFRATAGSSECYGEYRFEPEEDRPHRFNVSVVSAEIGELERLFRPTLRRDGNFIARTLRLRGDAAPPWLRARRAQGVIRIGTLSADDLTLRGVRANVLWTGTTIQGTRFEARLNDSPITGVLTANLSGALPSYRMRGNILNLPSGAGRFDITGQLETAGTGSDLLLNLKSEGGFQARALQIAPDYLLRGVSGTFALSVTRNGPEMRVPSVQAALGQERFTGEGETQDGRLAINLASSNRIVHMSGPVAPLKLEIVERSSAAR